MLKAPRFVLVAAGLFVGGTALATHAWSTYHWARTTPGQDLTVVEGASDAKSGEIVITVLHLAE